MSKHYIDDIGVNITVDCGQNISTATSRTIEVTKPDGSTTSWAGTVYASNYLRYTSVSGTFDTAGKWFAQPKFTLDAWTGRGDTIVFDILPHYS